MFLKKATLSLLSFLLLLPAMAAPLKKGKWGIMAGVGLSNYYRHIDAPDVPATFQKSNVTGGFPLQITAQCALNKHWSIKAIGFIDHYQTQYYQLYSTNGTPFKRYLEDKVNVLSYGIAGTYTTRPLPILRHAIRLYANAGLMIHRVAHKNLPQPGDLTAGYTARFATPIVQVGALYSINKHIGVFVEAGTTGMSALQCGVSLK